MDISLKVEEYNNTFLCNRCGNCCGTTYISSKEEKIISQYLKKNGLNQRKHISLLDKCPYFENNLCVIYPVRPLICRLMGITELMPCPNGNRPEEMIPIKDALQLIEDNFR